MLAYGFLVWPGIPPNSSSCWFAHAMQHLFTDDPTHGMQQPPLTQILYLYAIFLSFGMIVFFTAFNPSATKEKNYSAIHRENITRAHSICRSIPIGLCTARRIMVTYKYLTQGTDLFNPFIIAFFHKEQVQGA